MKASPICVRCRRHARSASNRRGRREAQVDRRRQGVVALDMVAGCRCRRCAGNLIGQVPQLGRQSRIIPPIGDRICGRFTSISSNERSAGIAEVPGISRGSIRAARQRQQALMIPVGAGRAQSFVTGWRASPLQDALGRRALAARDGIVRQRHESRPGLDFAIAQGPDQEFVAERRRAFADVRDAGFIGPPRNLVICV